MADYGSLRRAWVSWVQEVIQPQWLVTLTFRPPEEEERWRGWTHPGMQFVGRAAAELETRYFPADGIPFDCGWGFMVEERGTEGGRLHLHLAYAGDKERLDDLAEWWRGRYGFVNIKESNGEGVSEYVTKYVLKGVSGGTRWWFLGMGAMRSEHSVGVRGQ